MTEVTVWEGSLSVELRRETAPVQVEGCDLRIVSLQVHKVEDVLRGLLVSLLPDVCEHT